MTSHATAYETISSRGHVGPGLALNSLSSLSLPGVGWRVNDTDTNPIQHPVIPFSGYNPIAPPIASVWFRTITDDAAIMSLGLALQNNQVVLLDGVPLNNVAPPIFGTGAFGSGRLAPDVQLAFGGAVQGALIGLTGTTTDLDINASAAYQFESYMGMQHYCEFQENPPDSTSDGHERLAELLRLFGVSSSRYQIGTTATGAAVFVDQCGFAALDPSGTVYIRPEDIGPGSMQIPADMGDNSAASFRAHPSVFYPSGTSQYVRAITRQRSDPTEVNAVGVDQPIQIVSVTAAPTSSSWLVTVDGGVMVIRITHPPELDLRRPRDIWEALILPFINTGGADQGNIDFPNVATSAGQAVLSRMAYADYWRCLPIAGTRIIQTGGGG